ncbi:MAG: hypothetical protein ATN31_02580 [Candidatus Epulonipiscioides saccharophilum]|nr:MAG: hypothetical protein ATN31_02580 [Epulopiscium sp. AS2M-Bin001]
MVAINDLVIFRRQPDNVSVILDDTIDFENIIVEFAQKLDDNINIFEDININMNIKGRKLEQAQKEILLEILSNKNIMQVSFQDTNYKANTFFRQNKDKQNQQVMKYSKTCYWAGVLRSGQEIVSEGSAIIIGDVNPGAIIRARENIIVVGNLNGQAFAGNNADKSDELDKIYIIAYGMNPEQIAIGRILSQSIRSNKKNSDELYFPKMAYLNEGTIKFDKIDVKRMQFMLK